MTANSFDLFDIKNSEDMFDLTKDCMKEYCQSPTLPMFLLLVLLYNHLREWIAGSSFSDIQLKEEKDRTEGEIFFINIYNLDEYKLINEFCNKLKHYQSNKRQHHETSIKKGFCAGLSRCGDRLGQAYFMIDGRDSREVFNVLFRKYSDWFNCNSH